jgi:hypothetical protein
MWNISGRQSGACIDELAWRLASLPTQLLQWGERGMNTVEPSSDAERVGEKLVMQALHPYSMICRTTKVSLAHRATQQTRIWGDQPSQYSN